LGGLPALISAWTFFSNAFLLGVFVNGMVFLGFVLAQLGKDIVVFLDGSADLQQDGFVLLRQFSQFSQAFSNLFRCHFFAVLALCLKALAVGAPLSPGLRIRSGVLPAAFWLSIRSRFAAMLA
jgi:hypothetical protein